MKKTIVAIYCRLSEEDKNKQFETDDSGSIQNQKNMLTQYALDNNFEIYGIYSDDDYAGADRKRPEFNRMLKDAEARKFNTVLCKSQSRFTRELELVEKYIHGLFPLWGIRFIGLVDNADTDNKGNKKSRQINGLVNEWYLEDMSDNIRSVLNNRRQNGFHIGSFALYGYMKDPDQKGHLIIDEEAAAVVREVFVLFSQGYGKATIARILNERGIPNPTEYKRLHGLRYKQPRTKNSTLWKYTAISSMLKNEIYIGNMVQGKYGSISYKTKINKPRSRDEWFIVKGTHEPIIDKHLWDTVQKMIAQKAKPFAIGKIGLFATKARCAGCGYAMRSSKHGDRYYLQCGSRWVAKKSCEGAFIPVAKLESIVIEELNRLTSEYLDKDELERNIELANNLQKRKAQLQKNVTSYKKEIEACSKGLQDLYLDKVKGIVSEHDYPTIAKSLSERRDMFEHNIVEAEEKLTALNDEIAEGDNRRELIEKYTNVEHLTHEMVETLIEYVSIGKRDPVTKTIPVEIHWNF